MLRLVRTGPPSVCSAASFSVEPAPGKLEPWVRVAWFYDSLGVLSVDHLFPSPDGPVLDRSMLAELRGLGARQGSEFVERLLDAFRSQRDTALRQARREIVAGDGDALARIAHSLKGSCSNLAMPRAATVAARLERAGKGSDFEVASRELEALESALDEGLAALVADWHEDPGHPPDPRRGERQDPNL